MSTCKIKDKNGYQCGFISLKDGLCSNHYNELNPGKQVFQTISK